MFEDITGAILAGGESRRMRTNKSFLKLGNKTVIERTTALISGIFRNVVIITNEPELYRFLNIELFTDIYKGYGPIGGIHSALVNSITDKVFILSCDLPLINKQTIEFISVYAPFAPVVVPKAGGFVHQLCGVYNKIIINKVNEIIKSEEGRETRASEQIRRHCPVHRLIGNLPSVIINMETEYPEYHNDLFFNMNTPDDYSYIKKVI